MEKIQARGVERGGESSSQIIQKISVLKYYINLKIFMSYDSQKFIIDTIETNL